jgi:nucleoid-associated protein YgaU
MGIFDSVKKEINDASGGIDLKKLETLIKTANINVGNLKLTEVGKDVAVSGTVTNDADHSKLINLLQSSNLVEKVIDKIQVVKTGQSGVSIPGSEVDTVYTVVSGDTLSKIAKKFYGDASKYMKIFNANKELWVNFKNDPNILHVGWNLKIPK